MSARDKPWMCWACGYLMDAHSETSGPPRIANDGDCSVCLNCGAAYVRAGPQWRPMTFYDLLSLPAATRAELDRVLEARGAVIRHDLSRKPGNA